MITLSDGATTLELPSDLEWVDEFEWQPVVNDVGYTLAGGLVVESSEKQAGRPITLQGDNEVWLSRSDVEQLFGWASTPGMELTLEMYGEAYSVIFQNAESPSVQVLPVVFMAPMQNESPYQIKLLFLEI